MANKKKIENRIKIYSREYTGYLDEIPESTKEKIKHENPDIYKIFFEK